MTEQSQLLSRCAENTINYVEQLCQLSLAGITLLESYGPLMTLSSSLPAINTLKQATNDIYEATSAAATQVKRDVEIDILTSKDVDYKSLSTPSSKQTVCF